MSVKVVEYNNVQLSRNPKQERFFLTVVQACNGENQYRKFGYGGAIRGGKTFVVLFIFCYLCKRYPGSKWYVIREDFPLLQRTTMESLKKILRGSPHWTWHNDKSNCYVERSNGSRIYFMGENYVRDKELTAFLGLECNGIFFEQLEELNEKLWDIGTSRAGSWYLDPNPTPPAFIFTTFNPTQRWPKKKIYEPFTKGELPEDFFFMTALPTDNAYVTQDQWNAWNQMADRYKKQFIEGDWTDFDDTEPRWMFAFDEKKHVSKVPLKVIASMKLHLSFDFNINPMTCIVSQFTPYFGENSFCHILKEYELKNSTVAEMCKHIKADFPHSVFVVTGDASGRNRNAGYTSGNDNLWQMVQKGLNLAAAQIQVPKVNPSYKNSRVLCNTVLQNHNNFKIDPSCKQLIWDLNNARPIETDDQEKEDKPNKGAGSSELGLNLFDCLRYSINTHFHSFIKYSHKS